ncbi:MAG: PHP domain-containing protein [Propionibacteriaceae bacterium]|jgi:predicted metal-dependent phosphoesterase TrpH|nr:PHP domain-containing protein [Propionibacteriaceae bacterium]
MRADLHVHSAVSDGTDSPAELVAAAAAAGLDAIALTDHDTFGGWDEALAAGERCGVAVIPGIELSAHAEGPHASVHVLGYAPDPANPALLAELELIRQGREARIPRLVAALNGLGLAVTLEEVQAQAGDAVVGRPHVADALVARGYAAHRDEAFARWLRDGGPAQVKRYTPDVARAVDLLHGAGAVVVLAHPWGRGGAAWLPEPVLEALVRDHGLDGVEADHLNHDLRQRAALHALADRLGILATGSSDYHGLGKRNHPLGAFTTPGPVYRKLRKMIYLT